MKTTGVRNDLVTLGRSVKLGEFDCCFVRFGSRVAEKSHGIERANGKHLRPFPLRFHHPGVRNMDQFSHLLLHRLDHPWRAVSEQIAAPPGEKVDVTLAFTVPDLRTCTSNQIDRVATIIWYDVLIEETLSVRRQQMVCHAFSCLIIIQFASRRATA